MIYYIDTIEQTKGTEEGTINEYGKREKIGNNLNRAESKFHEKCMNVSNDLVEDGGQHYYMDIRIVDSTGGVLKKDKVGELQEITATE